ncbi:MAG: sialidase family protein, partial [Planctomycetaceae bacterium]
KDNPFTVNHQSSQTRGQVMQTHFPTMLMLLATCLADAALSAESQMIASGNGAAAPLQPQCAIDPAGRVHVIFGTGNEIWYCQSLDNSTEFTKPRLAFSVPNLSLGMRRGPRIVALKKHLVITAIGGPQGKGRDGDILAWSSQDQGQNWKGPYRVNDVEASAREGLHAMAGGQPDPGQPLEAVWTVWLDLRNKRTEICAARSDDGGLTWGPNRVLYTNPEKSVCECCHPSVAMDGKKVHVLFRNSLGGNRDMYLLSSADGGRTFAAAVPVSQSHWKLNACPMDGGMVAGAAGKVPTAVWRREGNVFRGVVGEPEQLLGPGDQPWIAASGDGPCLAWTSGKTRNLMLQRPQATTPELVAREAGFPVLASAANGSRTVLVWEQRQSDRQTVQLLNVYTRKTQ